MSRVLSSAPPLIICPVFLTLRGSVPSACFNGGLHVFPERFCRLPSALSVLSSNCATDCLFFFWFLLIVTWFLGVLVAAVRLVMLLQCAVGYRLAFNTSCRTSLTIAANKIFKCKQKSDNKIKVATFFFLIWMAVWSDAKQCVRFRVQRLASHILVIWRECSFVVWMECSFGGILCFVVFFSF